MGGKAPKIDKPPPPAPEPKIDPALDDPDAVNAAKKRLEAEQRRRNRNSLQIPLTSSAASSGTGIVIR